MFWDDKCSQLKAADTIGNYSKCFGWKQSQLTEYGVNKMQKELCTQYCC